MFAARDIARKRVARRPSGAGQPSITAG
jgi:hypothetical protein